MLCAYCIRFFLCLYTGFLLIPVYAHRIEIKNNERIKKMNNSVESQVVPSDWLAHIKKQLASKSGTFLAKDKNSNSITIEWQVLTTKDADFAPAMRNIANLASEAFTAVELEFLQAHPEAVKTERLYQQCAYLFQEDQAAIDWQAVKEKIYSIINGLYIKTDWSVFGADDLYIIMTIKNDSAKQLGFITFFIRPAYPFGNVKVTAMGIVPEMQGHGLGKLLMSSLFKIVPDIKRIFLSTRVTNAKAIAAYKALGFEQDLNPIQEQGHVFNVNYWKFMEYLAEKSETLQKTAQQLI